MVQDSEAAEDLFRPSASDIQGTSGVEQDAERCTSVPRYLQSRPSLKLLSALRRLREIARAIAQVGISKDQRNQDQKYNFRGIDDVMDAVSPLLAQHGIIVVPFALSREQELYQTKSGGNNFKVVVKMRYDFTSDEDGSFVRVEMYGEAMDTSDKASNKATSAAYKYALFQLLCIPIQGTPEEREADFSTPESRSTRPAAERAPVEPPPEKSRDSVGPETVSEALKRLVANDANRAKLSGKLEKAYGVALVDQIPADKVAEAIAKAEKFVAEQKNRSNNK